MIKALSKHYQCNILSVWRQTRESTMIDSHRQGEPKIETRCQRLLNMIIYRATSSGTKVRTIVTKVKVICGI